MKNKAYNDALRIAVYYLIVGAIWILLSDRLVDLLSSDHAVISNLQTYKGWGFIIITSLLLFLLVYRHFLNLEKEKSRLNIVQSNLSYTEQMYKLIFENSSQAILYTQPDGSIINANPEACRIFGRTEEEICKVERNGLVDLNDTRLISALEERNKTGNFKGELNFVRKDGTIFPGEISTTIFKDSDGNQKTSMFIKDITERKLSEEELRESEERFSKIFKSSPIAISIADISDGKLTEVNNAWCKLMDYSKEEAIGSNVEELKIIDQEHRSKLRNELLSKESFRLVESEITTKNGEKKSILTSAELITIQGNQFSINLVIDITERRRAEKEVRTERDFSKALLDGLPGIFYFYDSNFNFLRWNKNFETVSGYSEQEIANMGPLNFFPEDQKDLLTERINDVFINGYADVEADFLSKDGNRTPYFLNGLKINYKDKDCLIGIGINIEKRRKAEEKFRKLNEELEQLVVERTVQLEEANKELEAFSYSVSHDLRAPLRHISGYVELLGKHFQKELSEKGQHYLKVIVDSVRQMGILIDELLQFSRSGRIGLHQSISDMRIIVQEAVQLLDLESKKRNIEWKISNMPSVFCDKSMLKLVWINLLSNAVKFTRKRDNARIEIGVIEESRELVFFVRDNGVGFDMRYVQKLFGVFQRLHSMEEFEGTGIGLANVRRIISRHRGRTWAEAELDKGATFYFTLPKHKEMES